MNEFLNYFLLTFSLSSSFLYTMSTGIYYSLFTNVFFLFVEITFLIFFVFIFLYELYLIDFGYNQKYINYLIYFILPGLGFLVYFLLVDLLIFENFFSIYFFNFTFMVNYFVVFSKLFILLLIIIVFILSLNYFDWEKFQILEYPLFVLLATLGMFLLISAGDFFILYLLLEFVSFCFYIMASLKRYSNLSIEASLKYFILGSFSSAVLLFGLSLLYGFFGTTSFIEISTLLFTLDLGHDNYSIFLFGLVFISVGLLFKLAVFPFHFWVADVYEGSPLIVMVFFSILSKFVFLILFIKVFCFIFITFFSFISYFLFGIGLISILLGILLALYELKLRRVIAYSAISHVGYILVSLSSFSLYGLDVFFIYLFIYIITVVNFFCILLFVRFQRSFFELKYVIELVLLTKPNFFLAVMVAVVLLSFAGIPPFAGFFGKLFVFITLLESHNYYLVSLAVFFSVLNAVFYVSWFDLCSLVIS